MGIDESDQTVSVIPWGLICLPFCVSSTILLFHLHTSHTATAHTAAPLPLPARKLLEPRWLGFLLPWRSSLRRHRFLRPGRRYVDALCHRHRHGVTILRGWIRGPGFHPKRSNLVLLAYNLILARQALMVRIVSEVCGLAPSAPLFLISCAFARFVGFVRDGLMGSYRCSPTSTYAQETPACRLLGDVLWWMERTSEISCRSPMDASRNDTDCVGVIEPGGLHLSAMPQMRRIKAVVAGIIYRESSSFSVYFHASSACPTCFTITWLLPRMAGMPLWHSV